MEKIYAEHSNKLKSLANQARLAVMNTPNLKYSPSAYKTYNAEAKSLDSKLFIAKMNRPRERQAQIIAATETKAKRDANPNLDDAGVKKIKAKAIATARLRTGAGKELIDITPKEWDAIQAGAITDNKLRQMLDKSDLEVVRKMATPRTRVLMTSAKMERAQSLLASGGTRAEVAAALGVSLTTLDRALNGEGDED